MSDLSKLETVAGEAAEKLMRAVEKYGPQATEITLEVGRVAAIQTIVTGIAALIAAYVGYRVAKWALAQDWEGVEAIPTGVGGAIAVAGSIAGFLHLTNAFAWVGLFRPELYLAAKLLNL
jgi:hypothetical protein